MCRSIKVLRNIGNPVPPDEISAAALQFVRKVSGSASPQGQPVAFDAAVQNIAKATDELLKQMKGRDDRSESIVEIRPQRGR